MKYAASITIVNEEGDSVFEKELSPSQIVEVLLGTFLATDEEAPEHDAVEPTSSAKKSAPPATQAKGIRGVARACCGSKGARHMKGCGEGGKTIDPQRRRTFGNRHTFTEPTYRAVKTLLDGEGRTVDSISTEKGLDLDEVRRVNLSDDYADYIDIA